ncbi:MAG TPA: hypothetical protein VM032_06745 [Vicinamibacterales bacterium]|nr:hypothetical protein [Vicinamibacterales bacterium]
MPSWFSSLASGAAGAVALTAIHEVGRRQLPYAPRLDVLGMRALRRFVPGFEHDRPRSSRLRRWALVGDLLANSVYYAAVPAKSNAETWTRAAALGLTAGAGALLLPEPMGLGEAPHAERRASQAMTMAWYVAGALVAAAAANAIGSRRQRHA